MLFTASTNCDQYRNPLSSAIAALSFVSATVQERVLEAETRQALLDDAQIIDSSLQVGNVTETDIRILVRLVKGSRKGLT